MKIKIMSKYPDTFFYIIASLFAPLFFIYGALQAQPSSSYVRDYVQAQRAVVKITAENRNGKKRTGAGIFIEFFQGDLLIITAYHTIEESKNIEVEFIDIPTKRFAAEFIKADEELDIAAIKVNYPPPEIKNKIVPFKNKELSEYDQIPIDYSSIRYKDIEDVDRALYDINTNEGVVVVTVAPFIRKDFRVGDLIIKINDRTISDSKSFENYLSSLPVDSPLNYLILRRGFEVNVQSTKSRSRKSSEKVTPLSSLGHPAGHNWITRFGWLCNYSPIELKITQSITEEGISGGPLLDDDLNLAGIIIRKEDNSKYATAININAILSFLTNLKLPSRIWLSEESFCNSLKSALKYREKDYSANEIKIGAGKRAGSSIYYWEWDSQINLSSIRDNKIYKESNYGKDLKHVSILAENVYEGTDESIGIIEDVANTILGCLEKSYASPYERTTYSESRTITYRRKGKWDDGRITIINTYYNVRLEFLIRE